MWWGNVPFGPIVLLGMAPWSRSVCWIANEKWTLISLLAMLVEITVAVPWPCAIPGWGEADHRRAGIVALVGCPRAHCLERGLPAETQHWFGAVESREQVAGFAHVEVQL